jgi:hypothetical protein
LFSRIPENCPDNYFSIVAKIASENIRKFTNVDFSLNILQKGKTGQQHVKSDYFGENILMT